MSTPILSIKRGRPRKSTISATESRGWLNTADASEFLGVSRRTLLRYVQSGRIGCSAPSGRMLFKVSELEAFASASYCKRAI